jgi:hypothetical protein
MIPEAKLKISLLELSSKGSKILAQQPEITYAEVILQVKRLEKTSEVNPSSKKSRNGNSSVACHLFIRAFL